MGWGGGRSGIRDRAGFWSRDEEPGGASTRAPIQRGGEEVAWEMVSEYREIEDRPSFHYRDIPHRQRREPRFLRRDVMLMRICGQMKYRQNAACICDFQHFVSLQIHLIVLRVLELSFLIFICNGYMSIKPLLQNFYDLSLLHILWCIP